MTVTAQQYVSMCLGQEGDRYVFGAEANPLNPNPTAFDCSELTQWAADRLHVSPQLPDGAYNQWVHCPHISLAEAYRTLGALLFAGDGTGGGRDAIHHVAVSLGNGLTIEARGRKWGVGTWSAPGRFNYAGKIPGVSYTGGSVVAPNGQVITDPIVFKPGSQGEGVKFVQGLLNMLRSAPAIKIKVDGVFSAQTQAAVAEFQKKEHLHRTDGIYDDETSKKLATLTAAKQSNALAKAAWAAKNRPLLKPGLHGPSISTCQLMLAAVTGWKFSNTGTYDDNTRKGVANFQKFCGLHDDGICGPITWRTLTYAFYML